MPRLGRCDIECSIAENYVPSIAFVLRLIIIILYLTSWLSITFVAKQVNGTYNLPNFHKSIRDAFLFILITGFALKLISFFFIICKVMDFSRPGSFRLGITKNILSILAIFPISVCGFIAEANISSLTMIEQQYINKGAFAFASIIGIVLVGFLIGDTLYTLKQNEN